MTQPNPGDYVTPGTTHTTPHITTPGRSAADDNGVETHGASIVQMQESAWRSRAEAATAAAEELLSVKQVLSKVLTHNYFGEGCPEGTAVYAALRAALKEGDTSWAASLKSHINQLEQLSRDCSSAASTLSASDASASSRFQPVST